MTNNRQKPTPPEKTYLKKLPRLQPLNLQQLDGVRGSGGCSWSGDLAWRFFNRGFFNKVKAGAFSGTFMSDINGNGFIDPMTEF